MILAALARMLFYTTNASLWLSFPCEELSVTTKYYIRHKWKVSSFTNWKAASETARWIMVVRGWLKLSFAAVYPHKITYRERPSFLTSMGKDCVPRAALVNNLLALASAVPPPATAPSGSRGRNLGVQTASHAFTHSCIITGNIATLWNTLGFCFLP